jgi:hypothetical protein
MAGSLVLFYGNVKRESYDFAKGGPAVQISLKSLEKCDFARRGGARQFAAATRVSISSRNSEKSIGLVKSPLAPFSSALRLVSASP